ncbi:MAG: 6,7-dimethyl-8-ribityllumazine synthase [Burkholderiales bacterium]|nr:MAG: 6,7-dimethyl-8-ribityllumazine synthase [Burkholderiales bacterium]
MTIEVFQAALDGSELRVGIVQSRFNGPVCDTLRLACLDELARLGVAAEDVFVVTVPGALEIPFALARMVETGEFDALIALGAVIRGETYHFEVVSNESAAGVGRIALETAMPIANAILTTDTGEQAEARAGEKGRDAARVAVEMANLRASIAMLGQMEDGDGDEDVEPQGRGAASGDADR